jgi:hypothetical protein
MINGFWRSSSSASCSRLPGRACEKLDLFLSCHRVNLFPREESAGDEPIGAQA